MYSAEAGGGAAPGASAGTDTGSAGGDDVIDAEYEDA